MISCGGIRWDNDTSPTQDVLPESDEVLQVYQTDCQTRQISTKSLVLNNWNELQSSTGSPVFEYTNAGLLCKVDKMQAYNLQPLQLQSKEPVRWTEYQNRWGV